MTGSTYKRNTVIDVFLGPPIRYKYLIYQFLSHFDMFIQHYFKLDKPHLVSLEIFDSKGKKVRTLLSNSQSTKGEHHIQWDGKNGSNIELPEGIYIIAIHLLNSGIILLRK